MFEELPPNAPATIAIQTILYNTPLDRLERTLEAFDNTARLGTRDLMNDGLTILIGDASPQATVPKQLVAEWKERFTHLADIRYTFFNRNVGTSVGHNRLAASFTETDYIVTSNPDIIVEPRALWRMLTVFNDPKVGMVEAKQLPIEHPKDYDTGTGHTSWATTAFAMTPRALFDELEGFDAKTFFMYCDDVDYSWRVREAGRTVIFQPASVVFHDKQLNTEGGWMPTGAEVKHSASAALLLAHKWSRPDLVDSILASFKASKKKSHMEAATEFQKALKAGKLVTPRDPKHQIATFVGMYYAEHRFSL
jgi:GT2 family glycosyltransferase